MRKAEVFQQAVWAGVLEERANGRWLFSYRDGYAGAPVSLAMPVEAGVFEFDGFPPVFEGVLPEGMQLEAMLRRQKLDRSDFFGQLMATGQDLVGSLTVRELQ